MPEPDFRVAIVGAGMAGLSSAYYLLRDAGARGLAVDVRVFEESDRTGGVVKTERDGYYLLDLGPDSLFVDKPAAVELAVELGLADELIPANSHLGVSVLWNGKLHRIPEGLLLVAPTRPGPFFASNLFSVSGKARAMAEPLIRAGQSAKGVDSDLDEESIASFVRRRFGTQILERVAEPLMAGIHAGDADKLSIQQTFPGLPALEQRHGSVLRGMLATKRSKPDPRGDQRRSVPGWASKVPADVRKARFLSFRSGMQTLSDTVAAAVRKEAPYAIRTSTPLRQLGSAEATAGGSAATCGSSPGYQLDLGDGSKFEADACVLALPAFQIAKVLESLDGELAAPLREIPYVSTAAVYLGYPTGPPDYRPPFDGTGYLVPRTEERPCFGCTVVTRKFDHRSEDGSTLLRFFFGGALRPDALDEDDDGLIAAARHEAAELLGLDIEPALARVQRWPRANPQYEVGHARLVQRIDARLAEHPGLFIAGSSCRGVGIPDAIASGRQTAEAILGGVAGS